VTGRDLSMSPMLQDGKLVAGEGGPFGGVRGQEEGD